MTLRRTDKTFTSKLFLFLAVAFCFMTKNAVAGNVPGVASDPGRTSINAMADQYLLSYPEAKWLRDSDKRDANGNPISGYVDPTKVKGAGQFATLYPPTATAAAGFSTESKLYEGMFMSGLKQLGGFNGQVNSDYKSYTQELQAGDYMARTLQYPPNVANQAKAQTVGQAQAVSNAMGDIAKSQSASAISYCAGFLKNFTVDEGNKWNKIRNGLFVPIAILLLLPGAILTQVKAMAAIGNPILSEKSEMNPFEGILRSVVAIFLIPATYLVVNYGIDFSNSIINSIADTYQSVMGRNMYEDALNAEVRAFPVRTPRENQNSGSPRIWPSTQIKSVRDFENNYITDKVEDPSIGLYNVPQNKTDDAMPAGAVAAREVSFGANAALTAGWNILCAFQMAYLAYLFFVGPIAAALWVWPMKHFREALPNWVEGVCTLCFWSLFWNTAILLMACFKGVDESSTMIMSALNFLATSSVKYAFDFSGLVRAAGMEAGKKATEKSGGGKGGGKGNKGKGGAAGAKGGAGTGEHGTGSETHSKSRGTGSGTESGEHNKAGAHNGAGNGTSTESKRGLSGTTASTNTREGGNHSSAVVALPPLTSGSQRGAKNGIHSQNMQLGNYSISRGCDEHGKPVDLLKDAKGHVIAELPRGMSDGQSFTKDGLTVTFNSNANGSSYSLTDTEGRKSRAQIPSLESKSSSTTTAVGALDPGGESNKNSIALRTGDGAMLLENNGNTLLIPRADGQGHYSYSLEQSASSGKFTIADGRKLSMSHGADGGQQVTIDNQNGHSESFSVKANGSGIDITHSVDGTTTSSTKVSTDGNSTVYTNYDSAGRLTDVDKITGNNVKSTLYDPDKGQVLGFVVSKYGEDGSSQTSYLAADKSLTATSEHVIKPDGGFVDTVTDGAGQTVSVQQKTPTTDGGYTLQTDKYQIGKLASGQIATFDANSTLIGTVAVNVPRSIDEQGTNTNVLADVQQMAQTIKQATRDGNTAYLDKTAEVTGMSRSDLVALAQKADSGDPYAQTQLLAAYASNSGDQHFLESLASDTHMSVADVQALTTKASSGNTFAETQLMAKCATQIGDANFFNQIAAATNLSVPEVQNLTREAASGNVYAETQLVAAHAVQSGDTDFSKQVAETTHLSQSDAQILTEQAALGNVNAEAQLMSAYAKQSGDLVNHVAQATNLPVSEVQNLTHQAAAGNVYRETRLEAAIAVHAQHTGDNLVMQHFQRSTGVYDQSLITQGVQGSSWTGTTQITAAAPVHAYNAGDNTVMQHVQHSTGVANTDVVQTAAGDDVNASSHILASSAVHAHQVGDISQVLQLMAQSCATMPVVNEVARGSVPSEGSHGNRTAEVVVARVAAAGPEVVQSAYQNPPSAHARQTRIDTSVDVKTLHEGEAAHGNLGVQIIPAAAPLQRRIPDALPISVMQRTPPQSTIKAQAETMLLSNSDKLPPQNLSKDTVGEEQEAFSLTSYESSDQSLQRQLIDAGNLPKRTIAEILKCTSPSATTSDALASAHVNYTVLCSLLYRGMTCQAQQLVKVVDRDIQMLSHSKEAIPLIESYIDLLSRHEMVYQAQAFQNHLSAGFRGVQSMSNPW